MFFEKIIYSLRLAFFVVIFVAAISTDANATRLNNTTVEVEELDEAYVDVPLEEDLVVLDPAELSTTSFDLMLDSLMRTWIVELSYMPDCVSDTANTFVNDSIYLQRLAQLPHVIEMPYNNLVRSLIELYTVRRRGQVSYLLGLSNYYFPIFEQALTINNVPLELKHLPVIESALNTTAVSSMGAAGLWQFMIATGRSYGLEINSLVDERLDPIKSTYAAVRFLKDLYSLYGDWHLAIAAYNCGPGNVNKAIKRSGGKRDFWSIYPNLPRETRGYVPIFIAANYAMTYADQHNICPAKVEMPMLTDTLMLSKRVHFEQIAAVLELPVEKIKTLNPQYRKDVIPGDIKPYTLCLPIGYINAYLEKETDILAYKADELINNRRKEVEVLQASAPGGSGKMTIYTVKRGDTLGGIAKKHGVSVAKIRTWNKMSGSKISIGQRIKIYK